MMHKLNISGHQFLLLPERGLYWKETRTLIITDIHLGKSGHFRKSGIAAPPHINETNLKRMSNLIDEHDPLRVLILGDLFHSDANREWFRFEEWLEYTVGIEFVLVSGNHDTLHSSFYQKAGISVTKSYEEFGFHFIHHQETYSGSNDNFTFCGHLHPGIRLKGKGRQTLKLPCFYIKNRVMTIPAFGEFTGLYLLEPNDADQLFLIADNTIIEMPKV